VVVFAFLYLFLFVVWLCFHVFSHKLSLTPKMIFLPASPLSGVPANDGFGGAAVNLKGSLLASVHRHLHCVYIRNLVCHTTAPIIVGTAGTAGRAHGQLRDPSLACFVNRNGADTLLICDTGNHRVVEVAASGEFCRAISLKEGSRPFGIAYCETSDVIAVSLNAAHAVVLLQYESGAVKPEVTIGSGTGAAGRGDGQLHGPRGTFTADGRYILVADYINHRVSKFSAASGAFIAHVATKAANGILYLRDVLQCEDGSIVVTAWGYDGYGARVVCVGEDGEVVQNIIISRASGGVLSRTAFPIPRR
jgi:hypothetical protein